MGQRWPSLTLGQSKLHSRSGTAAVIVEACAQKRWYNALRMQTSQKDFYITIINKSSPIDGYISFFWSYVLSESSVFSFLLANINTKFAAWSKQRTSV